MGDALGKLEAMFWVAMVGSVTSSIYCLMVMAAAAKFGLRKRRDERQAADFLPAVSLLKPLHGTEPGMEANFESFFEQEYLGEWELLFCARQETDEGLQMARRVGARLSGGEGRQYRDLRGANSEVSQCQGLLAWRSWIRWRPMSC